MDRRRFELIDKASAVILSASDWVEVSNKLVIGGRRRRRRNMEMLGLKMGSGACIRGNALFEVVGVEIFRDLEGSSCKVGYFIIKMFTTSDYKQMRQKVMI